nr:MAG TPA: hypothetical protein [Caudoviricetes sp.]
MTARAPLSRSAAMRALSPSKRSALVQFAVVISVSPSLRVGGLVPPDALTIHRTRRIVQPGMNVIYKTIALR